MGLVNPHFSQLQTAGILSAHQSGDHQDGGQALGKNGGQSHAGHIHVKLCDKDHVENHVQRAREQQKNQWTFGVPGGTENGGAEVVHHVEGDARENNPHVYGGKGQYAVRRPHPGEEGFGETDAEHR